MKSITKQLNNNTSEEKKDVNVDEMDAVLMQEVMSSTVHFLWGYYLCFCRIKNISALKAHEFFEQVDSLPFEESEEDRKTYLQNNKDKPLEQFLYWYFYEE